MNYALPLSSVMTADPVTLRSHQYLIDVKHIYEATPFHHHIPVVDESHHPIGLIDLAGFVHALGAASLDESERVYNETTVGEIMSLDLVVKNPHSTIREAAEEFYKNRIDAILVTRDGKLVGIVTPYDLIKLMAGH